MTSFCRARLLAAATLLLASCAPVVTHGPRVDPGPALVFTAGTLRPLCDSSCTGDLIPALGMGLRYGYLPNRTSLPAVHVGVLLPVGDVAAPELDVYVQGPGRSGPWSYGAGVLSSPRHLMPYAQVGHTPEYAVGWYVTQGYAWTSRYDSWIDDPEETMPDHHREPRYWRPAVALRLPQEDGSMDVYLAGSFGHYVDNVVSYGPYDPARPGSEINVTHVRKPVRMLTAGVSINADLRSIGRAIPRISRRSPGGWY